MIDWSFVDTPGSRIGDVVRLSPGCGSWARTGSGPHRARRRRPHPGGWLAPHVHAFEEALYVLSGELLLDLGGRVHRLVGGDFALIPTGLRHALGQRPPSRSAALAQQPAAARPPTPAGATRSSSRPRTWPRWMPPPLAAVRRPDPPARRPLRRDTAAARGAARRRSRPAVARRPGRRHGAPRLQRDLREDAGRPHLRRGPRDDVHGRLRARRGGPGPRPPVRGGVRLPGGEVEGEIDGQHYTFRPGDVAFAGVGSVHGFYNTGTERVRWIETQAPQPPARHAYRWVRTGSATKDPEGGAEMSDDGCSRRRRRHRRASARRSPATTPTPGARRVLSGRDPAHVAEAVARDRRSARADRASTSPSRTTIRGGPRRSVGPVDYLALVGDRAR